VAVRSRGGPRPLVILAHGFGGTHAARLWAYAERFAAGGASALVFDYRHFGESAGEPRQLLSVRRQLEDWRAALAFGRSLAGVDPSRVALWGTSFGGGHVVRLAAGEPRVAAVISQAPFASGPSALRAAGLAAGLRLAAAGLRDAMRALRGREPYRIPVAAPPRQTGAMCQPGSFEGYRALFDDPDEDFRNEYCARVGLIVGAYVPALWASRLDCPLLVLTMAGDTVTPPGPARWMAARAPLGENIEYQGDHFDIYVGELFERTIADQIDFLRRQLGIGAVAAGEAAPPSKRSAPRAAPG
jgi:uncharacterized protein